MQIIKNHDGSNFMVAGAGAMSLCSTKNNNNNNNNNNLSSPIITLIFISPSLNHPLQPPHLQARESRCNLGGVTPEMIASVGSMSSSFSTDETEPIDWTFAQLELLEKQGVDLKQVSWRRRKS